MVSINSEDVDKQSEYSGRHCFLNYLERSSQ